MADQLTLKEFLVKIGFNLDESGMKKAVGHISAFTAGMVKLGAVVSTTAAAIEIMLTKQTRMFEDLYYQSQRIGSSVSNLLVFGSAANQIGMSADSARSAIEGMAQAMKTNPGLAGLMRGLGGTSADPTEQFGQFVRKMRTLPAFAAQQYAQMFGIPWQMLQNAMAPNGIEAFEKAARARQEILNKMGLTPQKLQEFSRRSREFDETLSRLGFTLEAVGTAAAIKLLPAIEQLVKWVTDAVVSFGKWNDELDGWPALIAGITIALGGVLVAFKTLGVLLMPIVRTAGLLFGPTGFLIAGVIAAGVAAYELYRHWSDVVPYLKKAFEDIRDAFNKSFSEGLKKLAEKTFEAIEHSADALLKDFFGIDLSKEGMSKGETFGQAFGEGFQKAFIEFMKANFDKIRNAPILHYYFDALDALGFKTADHPDRPFMGGGGARDMGNGIPGSGTIPPAGGKGGSLTPPNVSNMTESEKNMLGLIMKYESHGGRNEMNSVGRALGVSPTKAFGLTAQGSYQILNSNWRRIAPRLGISATNAMSASFEDQTKVALALLRERGPAPWMNFNPRLKAAIQAGETAQFHDPEGSGGAHHTPGRMGAIIDGMRGAGSGTMQASAGYGMGGGRFGAGHVNLAAVNQALVGSIQAAAEYLPAGYRVVATSGARTGGLSGSRHHGGGALDVEIVGPDGQVIRNRGQDSTGMYGKLARSWFNVLSTKYPGLAGRAGWGGEFETSPGSGQADLMHFDFGGRRGRFRRDDWRQPMNVDHDVNIHVHGVNDPHGTARAVQDVQGRDQALLTRNLRTAIA